MFETGDSGGIDAATPLHIAVVVVHGIRTDGAGYSSLFQEDVMSRLTRSQRERVEWREVFWGDVTRGNQRAYFERAKSRAKLAYRGLRWEFVLQGLGDAASYIRTRNTGGAAYHKIQDRLTAALDQLDVPDLGDRLLVLVGHSLGCQIISSYVWDRNRLKHESAKTTGENAAASDEPAVDEPAVDESAFRRLDTLAGIVTLGSNIPLFTFAFDPKRVIPITRARAPGERAAFPGRALAPEVAAKARWLNFFSPFDVLGYPLKPLNPAYDQAVDADIAVWSGRWMFWHPLRAHVGYWRNRTVINKTARMLKGLLE